MSSQGSSGVRIVASQEIPEETPTPATSPQTSNQPSPLALTMAFRALSMVLAAQLQVLLLVLNAMVLGWLVIEDPILMRCYAGAGYGFFLLACMWMVKRAR